MRKVKPEFKTLPIESLKPGSYQTRQQFGEDRLQELADSIAVNGLIQPIVVRPKTHHYEIVAGERRWRAAQQAGLTQVPCLINNFDDEQAAAVTTVENLNRVDLNPIEEALALKRMIDEFAYLHEEVAAVVGQSRAKITNRLRLLKLTEEVQQWLKDGAIHEGHGKVLAALTPPLQKQLARLCIKHHWSARKLEQKAKQAQRQAEVGSTENKDVNIHHLEQALSEHMGSEVNIDFAKDKGQVKIAFHDLDILEGLLEKMGFKKHS
jgi:ParB family chromosome partitioning protein